MLDITTLLEWLDKIKAEAAKPNPADPSKPSFDFSNVRIEARAFPDKPGTVSLVAYFPDGNIWVQSMPLVIM